MSNILLMELWFPVLKCFLGFLTDVSGNVTEVIGEVAGMHFKTVLSFFFISENFEAYLFRFDSPSSCSTFSCNFLTIKEHPVNIL